MHTAYWHKPDFSVVMCLTCSRQVDSFSIALAHDNGDFREAYFKIKKINGEPEKEFIMIVRVGYKYPSLGITVCHHSESLVMLWTLDRFV